MEVYSSKRLYSTRYKDEERLGLDARGWLRGFTMADCNVDDQDPPQQVLDPTGGRGE